jgi:drug/metabolite transporter (DMT)-like permease
MTLHEIRTTPSGRRLLVLVAAFAAVYVFWGSTYLAIKYAIETLPPLLMAGTRFLIAGTILFVYAMLRKDRERPTLSHWRTSFIVGTLLLLGGNGGVVLAERYLPSSFAALLIATEPLWIVILSSLWLGYGRPSRKVVLGLVIGFVGVWLLVSGGSVTDAAVDGGRWIGIILVVLASLSWAAGSVYGLRGDVPKSSALAAGMQMIAGSVSLLIVGTLRGELADFHPAAVTSASLIGVGYLVVFGSLVGYTAYSWLLKNARPSVVATYAYVNPIVAVILGWLVAGESMNAQMLAGAGVIVGSVVLITSQHAPDNAEESAELHTSCTPEATYST